MPSVCFYFQIHQPFRLRKYTAFESDANYFDSAMNAQLTRRIAENCYVPMNKLLLELIQQHGKRFRVAFSVTGTALEQFEAYAPEVLQGLHALAETGCVEFLGETFYHSLSALYSEEEFREQVTLHRKMIRRLFGQLPTVFRNTELIYSNHIGELAGRLGYEGILAEGWEPVLNKRSASFVYRGKSHPLAEPALPPAANNGTMPLLLLRNYRLSDAISFQFADARSPEFPLTEEKFAGLVAQIGGSLCNLFMDYETFGEHQSAATGIFDFMRGLPGKLLERNCDFRLPHEIVQATAEAPEGGEAELETAGELDVPSPISWADEARDLGAWMGNAMQTNALQELYALEKPIKAKAAAGNKHAKLLADWRKLTTSDHLYYMSTKESADGMVHAYFRPYDSPYDAYINFMNILDSLRSRAG